MQWLLLAAVLFSHLSLAETVPLGCDQGRELAIESAKEIYSGLQASSVDQDVSDDVAILRACLKYNKIRLSEIGTSDSDLKQYVRVGYKTEFSRAKYRLESALFGVADDRDVEDLRKYAPLAGVNTAGVEALIRQRKSDGEATALLQAGTCTSAPVDIARLGAVRNQGSEGWCFAYTAADLLSYKLKKRISAADVAISYYQPTAKQKINADYWDNAQKIGGFPDDAIKKAVAKGLCLESQLNSDDDADEKLFTAMNATQELSFEAPGSADFTKDCIAVSQIFRGIRSIADIARMTTPADALPKFADEACGERVKNTGLQATHVPSTDQAEVFDAIDTQLSGGNIVAMTVNSNVLKDRKADGAIDHGSGRAHSVIVAGRRFNAQTQQCEYLIRNSWGSVGNTHDPSYESDGHDDYWVPKAVLYRGTVDATYIP